MLRLIPHDRLGELGITGRQDFLRFLALCFKQKRKTLRNNLSARFGACVDSWPEARLRAEQADLATFAAMYHRLGG